MSDALPGEPADQLIRAAGEHDFDVSRTQLARWHRADLLPRPRTPSRGRGKGRESIYPAGTTPQLLALCRIHEHERRLPHVAWQLWWAGYDTPVRQARAMLARHAAAWEEGIREIRGRGADISEQAWKFLDKAETVRLPAGSARRARKRVGAARFPTLAQILMDVASGRFREFPRRDRQAGLDDDRTLLEAGLRVERARSETIAGAGSWLEGDIETPLRQLSRQLRAFSPSIELSQATDQELARARDDLRLVLAAVESFARHLELLLGRDALGIGGIAAAIRDAHPMSQTALLLLWRFLQRTTHSSKLATLVSAAEQWLHDGEPAFRQLCELREMIPATSELLSSKQIATVLRRPDALPAWFEALRIVGEQHREEVTDFFARQEQTEP